MRNIALISCGRSDYNVYLPLMKKLNNHSDINLDIIAAGTHSMPEYGNTIEAFANDGLEVKHVVNTISNNDTSGGIAKSMADTITEFSDLWESNSYDLIFVLGDRYEMFAAASSTIPFNIPLAHLHGGETTLGAIDDKFRHAITAMSTYHFTSSEEHKKRVIDIIGTDKNVFNVGTLSLEFINDLNITPKHTNNILFCYHPETVNLNNEESINDVCDALDSIDATFTVLLPNNDTDHNVVRDIIQKRLVGSKYKISKALSYNEYYTELANCKCMLGNSSSGIYEAASFGKYAINIGDRQKGRNTGGNVVHCSISKDEIIKSYNKIDSLGEWRGGNIYYKPETSNKIIKVINE